MKLQLNGSSCPHSTKPEKRADTSRCFPVVPVVPKQCCHGNSKSKGQLLAPNSDIPLLSFPKMPLTRCVIVWVPQTLYNDILYQNDFLTPHSPLHLWLPLLQGQKFGVVVFFFFTEYLTFFFFFDGQVLFCFPTTKCQILEQIS